MESNRKRIFEEMFRAALKEQLAQMARKYDWKYVFETWVQIAKAEGTKTYFERCKWDLNMTIAQALDALDAYCDAIECTIKERLQEAKGK